MLARAYRSEQVGAAARPTYISTARSSPSAPSCRLFFGLVPRDFLSILPRACCREGPVGSKIDRRERENGRRPVKFMWRIESADDRGRLWVMGADLGLRKVKSVTVGWIMLNENIFFTYTNILVINSLYYVGILLVKSNFFYLNIRKAVWWSLMYSIYFIFFFFVKKRKQQSKVINE